MKKTAVTIASGLVVAATFMWVPTPAFAERPRVEWSISIGAPGYYPPPAIYGQPQAIYVVPFQGYPEEVPLYPETRYGYYERELQKHQWRERQWRERQWREHEWHEHHDDDDD